MISTKASTVFAAVIFVTLSLAKLAVAQTPGQQVRETIQRVTAIVGSTTAGKTERQDALKRLILPRFDWNEMARHTLGEHWPATPEKQHDFVATFTEFIGNAYLGQIGSYHNQKVVYLGERREKNHAQVDTKLEPADGEPVSVNYKLHQVDGSAAAGAPACRRGWPIGSSAPACGR